MSEATRDSAADLRQLAGDLINGTVEDGGVPVALLCDAADGIDRLRDALQGLMDWVEIDNLKMDPLAMQIANEALSKSSDGGVEGHAPEGSVSVAVTWTARKASPRHGSSGVAA